MSTLLVYIAGPYRGPNEQAVFSNIMDARRTAIDVHAIPRCFAIVPHLNSMFMGGANDELADYWLTGDLEIVKRSDCVFAMWGWRQSIGAMGEIAYANEIGVPVFYNMRQLEQWAKDAKSKYI